MDVDTGSTADSGFDLNASIDEVAGGLGLTPPANGTLPPDDANSPEAEPAALDGAAADDTADTLQDSDDAATDTAAAAPASAPIAKPPPKSWAKDKHDLWGKLPPEAQDYYETREKQFLDGIDQYKGDATYGKQIRDVLSPYKPIIAAQGIDEAQAVQYLMNAHYRLTQGTREQRLAAYHSLGRDLQLEDSPAADQLPPEMRQLQERLASIESGLTARQQAEVNETRNRVAKEVNSFATDPSHPYFDDVADDIVAMIQTGHGLEDAYEKAVWANPVTRAKEIARLQTESEAKMKESASQEAEAARRASSTNIRGRETRRAPTEPKGTMEDTMRETLDKIKHRAH